MSNRAAIVLISAVVLLAGLLAWAGAGGRGWAWLFAPLLWGVIVAPLSWPDEWSGKDGDA